MAQLLDSELNAKEPYRIRKWGKQTITLANTGASNSLDIRGWGNIILHFPDTYNSTNIDIQVSSDDNTFDDLYTRDGTQITFTSFGIAYDVPELAAAHYVRFVTDADDSANTVVVMAKV